MEEECVVTKIKGKIAYVSLIDTQKCNGCKACAFGKSNKAVVPAVVKVECKVGDKVVVLSPKKNLPIAALSILFFPLLFLVVGFFVGTIIAPYLSINQDLTKIIFCILFFIVSMIICIMFDKIIKSKNIYLHTIIKVIKTE